MRPGGWKNPYAHKLAGEAYPAFEAGADAMLEGLLNQECFQCYVHDNPGTTIVISKPPMLPNGYLVFIPETP